MNVNFRLAEKKDVESIINLCNEVFNENTSLEYAQKSFEETKNDPNQIYVVGEVDGKIVAHTKITVIPTMYEDMNTYAILNHVCVKEEYRRRKLGTKLLDYCMKIAKEKGCIAIELWSKNFRVPAHSLYKTYGFEIMDAKFFTKDI